MGAFERVLSRLNSIWNKDPQRIEIATLTKPGAVFTIANLKCMVTEAGTTYAVSIANGTVSDFLAAMVAKGFTTVGITNGNMLARGIIEQAQTASGGSIGYHQSILWSELKTCCWEQEDQRNRISAAEKELYLHTADTGWIDWWGQHCNVFRQATETDADYANRIVAETIKPKANNVALENILFEAFGYVCKIRDAAPNVAELPLEEQGSVTGRFLLELAIPNHLTTEESAILVDRMKAVVRRNKATGTDFLQTVLRKLVSQEEPFALEETVGVTITASIEDSPIAGVIKCGTGWICGTPGLLCGTNEAIKEQIVVKKILISDPTTIELGLYGG